MILFAVSVYFAMKKYSVQNQVGLVVGSANPWVETACIRNGARNVLLLNFQHTLLANDAPKEMVFHSLWMIFCQHCNIITIILL